MIHYLKIEDLKKQAEKAGDPNVLFWNANGKAQAKVVETTQKLEKLETEAKEAKANADKATKNVETAEETKRQVPKKCTLKLKTINSKLKEH